MQAVRVCRAATEANISRRIFFLKRLFCCSSILPLPLPLTLYLHAQKSEKAEEEVAEDYFGDPGYGRSAGPT